MVCRDGRFLNQTQKLSSIGCKRMTYNLVKIARAPVTVCLQCPLCCNLVHEATTISECLHTFCRDCIYQRLGDGENDCCPICNVHLGCSPLEKLRADHQLDDVRAKIFPSKPRKRKLIDDNVDCDAPAPVRRKERSLSSLGIGLAPPLTNPGFVSRKTKPVSRRSMTIRDTSALNDFEETNMDMVNLQIFGAERDSSENKDMKEDLQEECSSDGKIGTVSEAKQQHIFSAKREIVSDEERETTQKDALQQLHKAGQVGAFKRGVLPHIEQGHLSVPGIPSNGENSFSKLGMYLTKRSKISATGLLHTEGHEQTEELRVKHGKEEPYIIDHQNLPAAFPVVRQRTGKGLKRRSALAQLAELAVCEVVESTEPLKPRGPRARRGRGKSVPASGDYLDLHSMQRISSAASQLPHNFSPLGKPPALDKLPIVRNMGSRGRMPAKTTSNTTKQNKRNAGLWFALQAADNQMVDNALPQISTRYLCIKDGKLPVSIVKKYLVKKLDLKSESEVEITCRGQPVVPNLPLESVQAIWFATMPSSNLLPSLRELNAASYDSRKWAQVKGTSAKDYMMVLTYGQHRKSIIGH